MEEKEALRRRLRTDRRKHVAALPEMTRALLFRRPPAPLAAMIPDRATIGLYHALPAEAPTDGYARWFAEKGHALALPSFAGARSPMSFRRWDDPWEDSDLEVGPLGALQPPASAPLADPQVVFVPLLGFTASGARLGQGGGHYDRWLAANPGIKAIGLAWDMQCVDLLPLERHDRLLDAVITPTRLYGSFDLKGNDIHG